MRRSAMSRFGVTFSSKAPRVLLSLAVLAAAALFGLVSTPAAAAQASLSCPASAMTGDHVATEVTIDVGSTPLGAYGITIGYDPAVVTIASVVGGNTSEFSGMPTTDSSTFISGSTRISALQNSRLDGPTGVVSVAKITFNVVASTSGTATVDLTVRSLFDTNGDSISATAAGCMVSVTGSGSNTTSTTLPGSTTSTTTLSLPTTTTTRTVTSSTSRAPVTTTLAAPLTTTTLVTTLPPSACPDAQAAAAVQAAIDTKCDCLTAKSHGAYVSCAAKEAKAVVKANGFPKSCQKAAKVCAAHSTCGKAGSVTCCRTNAKGTTKCSIKAGAAACKAPKGGQACVGQHPSCCDACSGGCG